MLPDNPTLERLVQQLKKHSPRWYKVDHGSARGSPRPLFGHMLCYGSPLLWRITLLRGVGTVEILASLGPSFRRTALNVKYRDFAFIIPLIVQLGLYISPVGFSSGIVPERWGFWYSLTPVGDASDGFRSCLLGGETTLYMPGFFLSLGVFRPLLVGRDRIFRRTERSVADLL